MTAPTGREQRESAVVEEVARAIYESDRMPDGVRLPWGNEIGTGLGLWDDYRANAVAAVAAYRATDGGADTATWPLVAALDQAIDRYEALREAVLEEADLMDARLAATGVLLDRCIRPGDRLRAVVADVAGAP